jgi:hypothetical protein
MDSSSALLKLRKFAVSEIKIDPKVKIVLSCGYSDSYLKDYIDDGFDGNLNKPSTLDDLNHIISGVFN